MDATSGLVAVLGVIALCLAVFLVLRALVLWYFRIGEVVDLLKSIDKKLGVHLDRNLGPKP